jgi:chemotaxis protein MotB
VSGFLELMLLRAVVIVFRVGGAFTFMPFFGSPVVPMRVKAALTLLFTAVLYPTTHVAVAAVSVWAVTQIVISEAMLGLLMGLCFQFVLEAVQLAGQLAGFQISFSLVNVIDPQSDVETPVLGNFQQLIALLLMLEMNVHHWIFVSYADFITLLFAFFVVLYSSSQVDKRKVGRLALAIQVAFQELGVFETSNTKVPISDTEPMPFANVQAVENVERTGDLAHFVSPPEGVLGVAKNPNAMKEIQDALEKVLAPEIKQHTVAVQARKEGIIVSLREVGFFDSGSSSLRPSAMNAVDRLAGVVAPRSEDLRIEGHTDNVPIHNVHFPSNWELSTARATEFVKLFIFRYHVTPSRLSAAGYAEFHPMDGNSTAEGRARNRRIDIVILNPVLVEKSPLSPDPPENPPSDPTPSEATPSTGAGPPGP